MKSDFDCANAAGVSYLHCEYGYGKEIGEATKISRVEEILCFVS
jgi:hypothetical protein